MRAGEPGHLGAAQPEAPNDAMQAPCGTSRRLRRRADAGNRSEGFKLWRDGFPCGLVSNDTFVRRRRLRQHCHGSFEETTTNSRS